MKITKLNVVEAVVWGLIIALGIGIFWTHYLFSPYNRPVKLGAGIAYAQEKAQVYRVIIKRIRGSYITDVVADFEIGKVAVIARNVIKKVFVGRYHPEPGRYYAMVYHGSRQVRIFVITVE